MCFHSVTEDHAAAVFATRRESMRGALEAVEDVLYAGRDDTTVPSRAHWRANTTTTTTAARLMRGHQDTMFRLRPSRTAGQANRALDYTTTLYIYGEDNHQAARTAWNCAIRDTIEQAAAAFGSGRRDTFAGARP